MNSYSKTAIATAIKKSSPKPIFELSEAQIEKIKTYSNILLGILAVSGMVTMMVLAPNALQVLDIFERRKGRKKMRHSEKIRKVTQAFYYLKRKANIEFRRKGDDLFVVLTDKGKKEIKRLKMETICVSRPQKWDGKFWQVAADIPTKDYRRGADALRRKLKEMGFYPLQRTLWFYPFDPRIEIEFITRTFGIAHFVTVMKTSELDPSDETVLKKFFRSQKVI